jgi:hypothetical protein
MRIVAVVMEAVAVERILRHLGHEARAPSLTDHVFDRFAGVQRSFNDLGRRADDLRPIVCPNEPPTTGSGGAGGMGVSTGTGGVMGKGGSTGSTGSGGSGGAIGGMAGRGGVSMGSGGITGTGTAGTTGTAGVP